MLMEYLGVKDHIQNLTSSNIYIATLSDRFFNCLATAENYITIRDTILNEMFAVLCESIMCTMSTVLESAVFEDRTRNVYYSLSGLLVFESAITEFCFRISRVRYFENGYSALHH